MTIDWMEPFYWQMARGRAERRMPSTQGESTVSKMSENTRQLLAENAKLKAQLEAQLGKAPASWADKADAALSPYTALVPNPAKPAQLWRMMASDVVVHYKAPTGQATSKSFYRRRTAKDFLAYHLEAGTFLKLEGGKAHKRVAPVAPSPVATKARQRKVKAGKVADNPGTPMPTNAELRVARQARAKADALADMTS